MLKEFCGPLATLVLIMAGCICSIDQLCQFYTIFQKNSALLESEQWLVQQCDDPHFFTKMHLHTDLCFTVSNNARVGAMMLSLLEFTQGLIAGNLLGLASHWGWAGRGLFSWGGLCAVAALVFLGPSWVISGLRGGARRWPDCREGHFKDA